MRQAKGLDTSKVAASAGFSPSLSLSLSFVIPLSLFSWSLHLSLSIPSVSSSRLCLSFSPPFSLILSSSCQLPLRRPAQVQQAGHHCMVRAVGW